MSDTSTAVATESPVLVSVENHIKTITINRPERKNALSGEVQDLIREAILESCANDDIRVTILTGAGGDFSSGADLSKPRDGKTYDVTAHLRDDVNPMILAMRGSNKPFIAKVRGNCVGLGCNIALACDVILASEDAKFSQIFVRIGLATDGGGSYFMPRAMGWPKAYERIVTGAMIPAAEADALGLISRVCKSEDLDAETQKLAERLATGPFVAIQRCKANMREGASTSLEAALEMEAVSQGICFKSSDFTEGVVAFMQKRKANFSGK